MISHLPSDSSGKLKITFEAANQEPVEVHATAGSSILDIARQHHLDLEGACEGSLACSTCHVIIDQEWYDKLEAPSDEEQDMLDMAFGLTDRSRLGCQVIMDKNLDGMKLTLPSVTRNIKLA